MIQIGTEWVRQCALINSLQDSITVPAAFQGRECISGISTDTRTLQSGELYIAIKGPSYDGHDYVGKAIELGAKAVLVDSNFDHRGTLDETILIRTQDTRLCLGVLGRGIRNAFTGSVIAVVGSNGKTTTKDLVASILNVNEQVLKSPASYNNDIGVPQTLFKLIGENKEILVLELGTNHPGEIEYLCRISNPEFGVLTNIGEEHIEFFGDLDGVIKEESVLPGLLPDSGFLVYDHDCKLSRKIAGSTKARTIGISDSTNQENIIHYSVQETNLEGSRFEIFQNEIKLGGQYEISLLGEHQVRNAVMALTVAAQFSIDPLRTKKVLKDFKAPRMRMEISHFNGISLIQDCYNANPTSTRAALKFLKELKSNGRKIIILGEHAEAGESISNFYREAIEYSRGNGIDGIAFVGIQDSFLGIDSRAKLQTIKETSFEDFVLVYPGPDEAFQSLKDKLMSDDILLLKGSRVAGLEKLAQKIKENSLETVN